MALLGFPTAVGCNETGGGAGGTSAASTSEGPATAEATGTADTSPATGSSGGGSSGTTAGASSEIGAALARYGLDTIIDLAVLTGATPFGRIDYPCMVDDGRLTLEGWDFATYRAVCEEAFRGYAISDDDAYWQGPAGDGHCVYSNNQREHRINSAFGDPGPEAGPCPVSGFPDLYDPALLAMASIAATYGSNLFFDFDHPNTAGAFLLGNENSGPDVISGKPYFDAVLGQNAGRSVLHTVAGPDASPVEHDIHTYAAGAELILADILGTPLDPSKFMLVHRSDPSIETGLGCVDRDGAP